MSCGYVGQFLLLLCVLAVSEPGAAQEPIGAPAACSAGQTDHVLCYIDSSGYLADVQFSNTQRNTPVSACGTQQWQLQASQLQVIQLSGSDAILRFRACGDPGGLRGVVFSTALGAELSCGSLQAGSSCRVFSSRSTYPLRGFQATCENLNPPAGHSRHSRQGQGVVTRVSSIKAACWTPARRPPASDCPAGYGVQGGGLPCQVCPVSTYSPGGAVPCKPCPAGTTTLTTGQNKCGCFPGYGVYGPVNQDPDVCELCPAGTYSTGGALAPCQPCSTNAFDYLTSGRGSISIADCTCAAGYGVTPARPNTCRMCPRNYFSEGALAPAQLTAAEAALTGRTPASTARPSSTRSAVASSSNKQLKRKPAPTGAPPPAPAPAAPKMLPAPSLVPSTESKRDIVQNVAAAAAGNLRAQQQGVGTVGVAAAAAGGVQPQQASVQQVNLVFSTPTYNPCTFCGPGCTTEGPGAVSPGQCSCVNITPASPSPYVSPSPSSPQPSTSPAPPGGLSPSPSTSPPPPPSPSPAPTPSPSPSGTQYCVACDTNKITQTMNNLCGASADATFPIYGDALNGPCWDAFGGTTVANWVTERTNIFASPRGPVSCSLVRVAAGISLLSFIGAPPAGSSCLMPSQYVITIPQVTGPTRGGRTRRTGNRGHLRHQGSPSNHTSAAKGG